MKVKRIGIDVRMYNASGIGRYIRNIVIRLVQNNPNWQFFLLGNIDELQQTALVQMDNVQLIDCTSPIYGIKEQIELYQKIPQNLTCFWSPHWNIPLLYSGRLIVTIHDMFHLAHSEYVGAAYKLWYAKLMFLAIAKKAKHVFTVSNFSKQEISRYTTIDPTKVSVVYNGIDDKWFGVQKGKPVHKRRYILYVGNVKPHKNLVRLVKAFRAIKDEVDCDLVIIGRRDGFITGDAEVGRLVGELGHRVVFTGFIDDSELEQYYAQAALFVFPSLYEGFGLPPLEAMACSCPVVVSTAASLPEVCGDAAIYVDPHSVDDLATALNRLLADDGLGAELIARGQKRSTEFTWDKSVTLLEDFIKKIVD